MLEIELKRLITHAVKEKDETARDVLRVVLGQIQLDSSGKDLTEEQKLQIVRKVIKSNKTTIDAMNSKNIAEWPIEWHNQALKLVNENDILQILLPKVLDEEAMGIFLQSYMDEIKSLKSDGQATGFIIKLFKSASLNVEPDIIKTLTKKIRSK